jgi:hypothetical protein
MACVVSAPWRPKEGCERPVAEMIPELLESRGRAFHVTLG